MPVLVLFLYIFLDAASLRALFISSEAPNNAYQLIIAGTPALCTTAWVQKALGGCSALHILSPHLQQHKCCSILVRASRAGVTWSVGDGTLRLEVKYEKRQASLLN